MFKVVKYFSNLIWKLKKPLILNRKSLIYYLQRAKNDKLCKKLKLYLVIIESFTKLTF